MQQQTNIKGTRKIMIYKLVKFLGILSLISLLCVQSVAQLQVGFYQSSCFLAEFIVKQEVQRAFLRDNGIAAGLVRLHFHDCFVRGCDGSVLIDSVSSNTAEKDAPPNNPSLRGFEVIDNAKARIEAMCKGTVSCADIVAFAARDSVEMTRGFGYDVPAGRKDGRVSLASEALANLPPPTLDVNQLTRAFGNKGLSQEEMVTLSGAHTLGRSHCTSFTNRLYNFSSSSGVDPTLNPAYAAQLIQRCPRGNDPTLVVPMDPTPAASDTAYYSGILANRGLFTSDQTLISRPDTRAQVVQNAQNQFIWSTKFAAAMVKMGSIGVLTGNAGEIRANCRVINS